MSTPVCVCVYALVRALIKYLLALSSTGDSKCAKQRLEKQSDKRQEESKQRKTEREGIEREIDEMKERGR